jgi:CheY-like chemotaxis protein
MPPHTSPPELSHRLTILLIDDEKEDRKYWSNALRNSPHRYVVLEADSGASGFNLFQAHGVDCVVLDLDMPESGFFTLIRLIPDPKARHVPVVILTHLMEPAFFQLVQQYGAFACLVKHLCSTQELAKTIQEAMAAGNP